MFEIVCQRIEKGRSVRKILKDKDVFSDAIFFPMLKDSSNNKRYARACIIRADNIFEEIIEIADKQEKDIIETDDGPIVNHNVINRNRLQIDARKWVLSKMQPKRYGESSQLDLTTKGESLNDISRMPIEELEKRVKLVKMLDENESSD